MTIEERLSRLERIIQERENQLYRTNERQTPKRVYEILEYKEKNGPGLKEAKDVRPEEVEDYNI